MNKLTLTTDEEISAYYRGSMIQKTIDLELRMDILIGRFLSMGTQNRVLDIIEIFDMTEINFSSKIKILSFIIKKHFIEFKNTNGTFFKDLGYLMEKRNILAHRRPDLKTNDYLKLSWAKSADKSIQTTYFDINEEFYSEFSEKCAETYMKLIDLECEILKWIDEGSKEDSN